MPSHSLREKEFALQNDGFINKLLKPELPCTQTRQSNPVTRDGPIWNIRGSARSESSRIPNSFLSASAVPCSICDEASSSERVPVLTLWALGSNLVLTEELYLVGVHGNSGLRSLVMKPLSCKANYFSRRLWWARFLTTPLIMVFLHFNYIILN